jgi:hypothetical protein
MCTSLGTRYTTERQPRPTDKMAEELVKLLVTVENVSAAKETLILT